MVTAAIEVPNTAGLGSGGSTHVFELVSGLKKNNIEVSLFCARGCNQQFKEFQDSLKIYRIFDWKKKYLVTNKNIIWNKSAEQDFFLISALKKFYRFLRDIVYTIKLIIINSDKKPLIVYERISASSLSGSYYAILMGIPLIVEANDLSFRCLSLRYARFIVTPDPKVIPKKFQKKCILTPWGVDIKHFSRNTCKPLPASIKSLLDRKTVILFTGSFLSWHGLYDLVDAADKITKVFKSVIFLLVGDGPERSRIEAYVNSKKLTSFFIFTGFVPYDNLPQYMASADIGIAPYNSQLSGNRAAIAVPLKVLEYMSMGLPVVVSESGNFQKLVTSGINGLVYPTDDFSKMASAIQKLITNKNLRSKFGRNARKKVTSNFSWESHCDKIRTIISSCI